MGRLRRLDSLFLRLLLTQLAVAMALGISMGSLFYLERNATIAALYAELWAPQLAQAAGLQIVQTVPTQIVHQNEAPKRTRRLPAFTPRFISLRDTLAKKGLSVDEVRLNMNANEPMVWVHVMRPQSTPVWLGMPGEIVVTEWPARVLLALTTLVIVLSLASWTFTRRLTRPLEQLRQRMQALASGNANLLDITASGLPTGSAPEITAIDIAYTRALARLALHHRERAVLLAGVSHDLRSPLSRIRMAADLLPDAPDTQARKESIARNVGVADKLIESFMDYVRSETLAVNESVDLAEAVVNAAARCDRPAEELSIDTPTSLMWPQANALLVDRLVSNLLDNAFKHGRPPVRVQLSQQGNEVWLDVTDAGPGIAPEDVEAMQQAFSRGTNSRIQPGTGLGLAIVRQVAQRLGGRVEFTGAPGAHTVRVRLGALLPDATTGA